MDKHFLIVYGSKFIELQFLPENFLHLTGVGTSLSAVTFFDLCLSNQLTTNQFFYNRRYPSSVSKKKVNNLFKILNLFRSDSIILEEITTDTQLYEIGITELHFTLCFKNFINNSNLYTVCSHRIENMSASIVEKSKNAYFIDCIFSKSASDDKYNHIVFGGLENIKSEIILNMVSNELTNNFI
ncbi:PBECR4 domain-containing protein [Peptoniphilus vaginalis]|uniref:PBECR4 domain-containing protein n=1 Tax=Peptoniphilus vaginalis TaxID=1756987 RepID=UPI000A26F9D8|nr:PBECR4 domain-containing protein [Peptoniphilus vaginalis]